MKNIFYFLLLIIFSCYSFSKPKKYFIVIIDAGHGGKDLGAVGYGLSEKNITLSVVKKIGKYIEKKYPSEVKVIYTREKDVFVSLRDRVNIANKNHADLFISIHCNSSSSYPVPEGTETYVLGLSYNQDNFEVTKRENSSIFLDPDYKKNYHNFDPNSPEFIITLSLVQSMYLKNSINFAKKIEENFQLANRKSRGVKQGNLFVNREVYMSSVLIEIGFITNRNENSFLGSSFGQELISKSIYKSFVSFKNDCYFKNNLNYLSFSEEKEDNIKDSSHKNLSVLNKNLKLNNNLNVLSSLELVYTIQILSLSKKISNKDSVFRNLKPIFYYKEKNLYKYLYGKYLNLETAKEKLFYLKNLGFSSAFILSIKDRNSLKEI